MAFAYVGAKLKVRTSFSASSPSCRTLYAMQKKATAQIAHLVFSDTKANAKKPKELFYCQTHID